MGAQTYPDALLFSADGNVEDRLRVVDGVEHPAEPLIGKAGGDRHAGVFQTVDDAAGAHSPAPNVAKFQAISE